jgi:threonine aldolase
MIDLRSDTVTRPDAGMRAAMAAAEVGDDVFGEDPTVNRLQRAVADLLGKQDALFTPSGVMANQIGVRVHTEPGDEAIVERSCHIFNYECGSAAVLSGVQLNPLDGERGLLDAAQVRAAVRRGHYWEPRTRLVCLENTANKAGGTVYPLERVRAIAAVARELKLAMHLDGARLWNACAATGLEPSAYAGLFDTVSVCLSKGLGAPVGSVLAGTHTHIERARRWRKVLGGGMRQAGILAAAGLYALEHNRPRLAEDHVKAQTLARGLAKLRAFRIDPAAVQTNIVMFDVVGGDADAVVEKLAQAGVAMSAFGPSTVRATTHLDVSGADIERALEIVARLFA